MDPWSWPPEFLCPISRSVMADPVIVSSGQTYERRCIEAWMNLGQNWCVKQKIPLDRNLIIPNSSLKAAIFNMAKSRGMRNPPSPPPPDLADASARRLIQEINEPVSRAQEPWYPDLEAKEESGFDAKRDGHGEFQHSDGIHVEEEKNEQEEAENEDLYDRVNRSGIVDEAIRGSYVRSSPNMHPIDVQSEYSVVADGRRGNYMKSLSSLQAVEAEDDDDLCNRADSSSTKEEARGGNYVRSSPNMHPIDVQSESLAAADGKRGTYMKSSSSLQAVDAHMESPYERRQSHLKSSSTLPPLNEPVETIASQRGRRGQTSKGAAGMNRADAHHRDYAREAANLEQDFEQFRVSNERSKGGRNDGGHSRYARMDGCLTNPIRYTVSTSGEALLEASQGTRELPPNLAIRPSSYSSSEAPLPGSVPLSPSTDPLVQGLEDEREEVQEAAVKELRQLTRAAENRLSLGRTEIIKALLPLLKSRRADIQINAVAALVNLSLEKPNKVVIVRAGAVRPLVEVLDHGFPEAQEHAAGAAFSLALDDENKHLMGVLNAVPPLFKLLQSGPPGSRQDAAMALYHLSMLQANKSKLVKIGAVPSLLNLAQSKERPDMASRCLLILSNVASVSEGRSALLQLNAIATLVKLLSIQNNRSAAAIPEQAASVLVLLSKDNPRFRPVALNAGARELLVTLAEKGTPRARQKAAALLAIMRERSSVPPDESDADSLLSRQYQKLNADGAQTNTSVF